MYTVWLEVGVSLGVLIQKCTVTGRQPLCTPRAVGPGQTKQHV